MDGIPDCSEQPGKTYASLPLYDWGARVGKKDIFIEVDYMDSTNSGKLPVNLGVVPQRPSLDKVRKVFEAKGYAIHFDVGDLFDKASGLDPADMDLGGGNKVGYSKVSAIWEDDIANCNYLGCQSLYKYKENMDPHRRQIFHYMLFGVNALGTEWGRAERPGNDILFTMGSMDGMLSSIDPTNQGNFLINEQASTVMHELGHNLGLKHGGNETRNYKPNYLSIMNYLYDTLPTIGSNEGDRYYYNDNNIKRGCSYTPYTSNLIASPYESPSIVRLDYSDGSSADLDEAKGIDESRGLGVPPVIQLILTVMVI